MQKKRDKEFTKIVKYQVVGVILNKCASKKCYEIIKFQQKSAKNAQIFMAT